MGDSSVSIEKVPRWKPALLEGESFNVKALQREGARTMTSCVHRLTASWRLCVASLQLLPRTQNHAVTACRVTSVCEGARAREFSELEAVQQRDYGNGLEAPGKASSVMRTVVTVNRWRNFDD